MNRLGRAYTVTGFSPPCMPVVRLSPSPAGLLRCRAASDEVSRFSCMQFLSVPGVYDYVGSGSRLAFTPAPVRPSPNVHRVGIPEPVFEAQYPAH
jgi:hypothetical protein